jgi:hypothetical protein
VFFGQFFHKNIWSPWQQQQQSRIVGVSAFCLNFFPIRPNSRSCFLSTSSPSFSSIEVASDERFQLSGNPTFGRMGNRDDEYDYLFKGEPLFLQKLLHVAQFFISYQPIQPDFPHLALPAGFTCEARHVFDAF